MTGPVKAVLVSPGPLEQSPAGSQKGGGGALGRGGQLLTSIPAGSRGEERGDIAPPSNPEGKSHLD